MVYAYDLGSNQLLEIKALGEKPNSRTGHCAVNYGEEMLIFGGSNEVGLFNDIYVLDLKFYFWKKISTKGVRPTGRQGMGCVIDRNQRLIVYGGYTSVRKIQNLSKILSLYSSFS